MTEDLSREALEAAMPGRPVRTYQALLSTEADAVAWAREGAPEGAVVVADYQASPRGRGGQPWQVVPGRTLAFSLVLRLLLATEREGWVYTVVTSGVADALGDGATIAWPDEVWRGGTRAAAAGAQVALGPAGVEWVVVSVLIEHPESSRAPLLARLVAAIEARAHGRSADVLADYVPRCATVGHRVRARLVPLGPNGPEVIGNAVAALKDGALVIETDAGRRVAVRPQSLGLLDDPAPDEPDEPGESA